MLSDREPERLNPYAAPALTESHIPAAAPLAAVPASLQKVARGLSIYRTVIILGLIASVGAFLAALLLRFSHQPQSNVIAVSTLTKVFGELCLALAGLGMIYCLAIPREAKSLPMVQAAVLLALLRWVIYVSQYFGQMSYLKYYYSEVALRVASAVCFFLFIRRTSQTMERYDLARRAHILLWLCFMLSVFYYAMLGPLPKELDIRAAVPVGLYLAARWTAYLGIFWLNVRFIYLLRDFRLAILSNDGAKLLTGAAPDAPLV